MTTASDEDGKEKAARVLPFPHSRVTPAVSPASGEAPRIGEIAATLGIPIEQTTGHWCSRCNKLWYGYLTEVACPACGNRHG